MNYLSLIASILLVIGGLNWGLIGLFDFNLVQFLFGNYPLVAKVIYILVGLSAIWHIFQWPAFKNCFK